MIDASRPAVKPTKIQAGYPDDRQTPTPPKLLHTHLNPGETIYRIPTPLVVKAHLYIQFL